MLIHSSRRLIGLLALLWVTGLFLRIPVLAPSPLAGRIADDLDLSTTGTGALTVVPVAVLAVAAPLAAWATAKIGPARTIALGLLLSAILSGSRGLASSATMLFTASIGMGVGIALFQTALPSAVKAWLPTGAAVGSAVYLNGMMVGELLGAGATLPVIMPMAGDDWRVALMIWAVPAALVGALVLLPEERGRPSGPAYLSPDWSDNRTWELGFWLAGSTGVFFSINAYMATTLSAQGNEAHLETLLLAYNTMPLLASLVMFLWKDAWIGRRKPIVVAGIAGAVCMTGFGFLPGAAGYALALAAGFAATLQLILIMSLPPEIAEDTNVARLTGGITFIGYLTAFVLPLLGGVLSDILGVAGMVFVPTAVFVVVLASLCGRGREYTDYAS